MTIRQLSQEIEHRRRNWRARPNGYEELMGAHHALQAQGERLRQALPVPTSTAYAYSPRENTGSGGGEHIILKEALRAGRLNREAGDALCKPAEKFWGLTELDSRAATCLRCLEIAERLAR